MARRAGKAATRKSRQRKVTRSTSPSLTPGAPSSDPVESLDDSPSAPSSAPAPASRRPVLARQPAGSQLTAAERSEYHYVERDLRDIAILTAVMAALLLVAWFVFSTTGLVS